MKIAVFCSGNGSNLQALIDAARPAAPDGESRNAEIALVVSDRPACRALERAASAGIPTFAFQPKDYDSKEDFERQIGERVDAAHCALIVLAGYMRILSPWFTNHYSGRIINIHPSLLPAFPGAHGISDAWKSGVKITGCTVHAVVNVVDAGPIIEQRAVRIEPSDTLETLEARIHAAEHQLLPDVVRRIAIGEIGLPITGARSSERKVAP